MIKIVRRYVSAMMIVIGVKFLDWAILADPDLVDGVVEMIVEDMRNGKLKS